MRDILSLEDLDNTDNLVPNDQLEVDDNLDAELDDDIKEYESNLERIEEYKNAQSELLEQDVAISEVLDASRDQYKELTPEIANVTQEYFLNTLRGLGYQDPYEIVGHYYISTEYLNSDPYNSMKLTQEGIKDVYRKLGAKIDKYTEKVRNFMSQNVAKIQSRVNSRIKFAMKIKHSIDRSVFDKSRISPDPDVVREIYKSMPLLAIGTHGDISKMLAFSNKLDHRLDIAGSAAKEIIHILQESISRKGVVPAAMIDKISAIAPKTYAGLDLAKFLANEFKEQGGNWFTGKYVSSRPFLLGGLGGGSKVTVGLLCLTGPYKDMYNKSNSKIRNLLINLAGLDAVDIALNQQTNNKDRKTMLKNPIAMLPLLFCALIQNSNLDFKVKTFKIKPEQYSGLRFNGIIDGGMLEEALGNITESASDINSGIREGVNDTAGVKKEIESGIEAAIEGLKEEGAKVPYSGLYKLAVFGETIYNKIFTAAMVDSALSLKMQARVIKKLADDAAGSNGPDDDERDREDHDASESDY